MLKELNSGPAATMNKEEIAENLKCLSEVKDKLTECGEGSEKLDGAIRRIFRVLRLASEPLKVAEEERDAFWSSIDIFSCSVIISLLNRRSNFISSLFSSILFLSSYVLDPADVLSKALYADFFSLPPLPRAKTCETQPAHLHKNWLTICGLSTPSSFSAEGCGRAKSKECSW